MAFFKAATDREVTFAPDRHGGVRSWFNGVANTVQSGQRLEKQLAFNLKKLVTGDNKAPNLLAENEADAPEADWWSGGKQAVVVAEQFARSSSSETAEEEEAGTSSREDSSDADEFEETRPSPPTRGGMPSPSARTSIQREAELQQRHSVQRVPKDKEKPTPSATRPDKASPSKGKAAGGGATDDKVKSARKVAPRGRHASPKPRSTPQVPPDPWAESDSEADLGKAQVQRRAETPAKAPVPVAKAPSRDSLFDPPVRVPSRDSLFDGIIVDLPGNRQPAKAGGIEPNTIGRPQPPPASADSAVAAPSKKPVREGREAKDKAKRTRRAGGGHKEGSEPKARSGSAPRADARGGAAASSNAAAPNGSFPGQKWAAAEDSDSDVQF
mmetsp:Transcript_74992/g.173922  ORF Transcript_74992/g.173922 Transcript_74992/m.173922 type:complete len:384 (-) Transcript_74992:44-1195(-)